jgi:hypothetical protein
VRSATSGFGHGDEVVAADVPDERARRVGVAVDRALDHVGRLADQIVRALGTGPVVVRLEVVQIRLDHAEVPRQPGEG